MNISNCQCNYTVRFHTRYAETDVVLKCLECFGVGGKSGNVVHDFNCTQKGCSHDDRYYKSPQQFGYKDMTCNYARQQVVKDLIAATDTLMTMRIILEGIASTNVGSTTTSVVEKFYLRNEQQKIQSVIQDMTNLYLTIPW